MGIEPTSEAWEASILPLYDARSFRLPRLYLIAPPREKVRARFLQMSSSGHENSNHSPRRPHPHRIKLKTIHPRLDRRIRLPKYLHLSCILHLQHRHAKSSRASHHRPINQYFPRVERFARVPHVLLHQRSLLRRHIRAKRRPRRNQLEIKMFFAHRMPLFPVVTQDFRDPTESHPAKVREIIAHFPQTSRNESSIPADESSVPHHDPAADAVHAQYFRAALHQGREAAPHSADAHKRAHLRAQVNPSANNLPGGVPRA